LKGFSSLTKLFAMGIIVMAGFIIQRCCCSCSTTIMSCMVLFYPFCFHLCLLQDPFFYLILWSHKSMQQFGTTFEESLFWSSTTITFMHALMCVAEKTNGHASGRNATLFPCPFLSFLLVLCCKLLCLKLLWFSWFPSDMEKWTKEREMRRCVRVREGKCLY